MEKFQLTFVKGRIPFSAIEDVLIQFSKDTTAGAHHLFIGQVRSDEIEHQRVDAIHYTTYEDMAREIAGSIFQEIETRYEVNAIVVLHSLGDVLVGESCLCVAVSSPHRKDALGACNEMVERIKNDLPIWGKEIFQNQSYQWKINK